VEVKKTLIIITYILINLGCGESAPNEDNVKVDFKNLHQGCELIEIEHIEFEDWFTQYNVTFIENEDTVLEFWNYHTSGPLNFDNFTLEVKREGSTPFLYNEYSL
jgi:hypothetical protein